MEKKLTKKVKKILHPLFSISSQTYVYDVPFDVVKEKMHLVFEKSGSWLHGPDIIGRFTGGDTFVIETKQVANTKGVIYRSMLWGTLQRTEDNKTVVVTYIKSALSFRFLFIAIIFCGLINVSKDLFSNPTGLIWPGFLAIIVIDFLAIKCAAISNAAVKERYIIYVDKNLRRNK